MPRRIDRIPIMLGDEEWVIKVIHSKSPKTCRAEGWFDPKKRTITLYTRGTRRNTRWILLHEMLHKACPYMDEEEVDRVSHLLDHALGKVTLP